MKSIAAVFGAGAVVAMAGLTAALEESPAQQVPVAQPEITTGQTSTVSTAPTVLETSVAVPPFTTAPYTNITGEVH